MLQWHFRRKKVSKAKSSDLKELVITLFLSFYLPKKRLRKVKPFRQWDLQDLKHTVLPCAGRGQLETGTEKAQTASIHLKPGSARINANIVNPFNTKWRHSYSQRILSQKVEVKLIHI